MVLQDAWLFDGTIAGGARPTAVPRRRAEEIVAAARAAQVDFLLRTMPQGSTRVWLTMPSISQGQRQLLSHRARAAGATRRR